MSENYHSLNRSPIIITNDRYFASKRDRIESMLTSLPIIEYTFIHKDTMGLFKVSLENYMQRSFMKKLHNFTASFSWDSFQCVLTSESLIVFLENYNCSKINKHNII